MQFLQFVNTHVEMESMAALDLQAMLQTKTFDKGSYLVKRGEPCRKIYFVEEGLLKTSFNRDGKEFIMRFFPESSMFTVLDSYTQRTPSTYNIIALEKSDLSFIDRLDFDALCKKYHCVETFFRKLVTLASLNMMKRISEMLEENAHDRYNNFVEENGALLQRISLGDLANYLGITQVSLSRIRAKN